MCIDEVKDDFLEFTEAPADFKRVVNVARWELLDELSHLILHGQLFFAVLIYD